MAFLFLIGAPLAATIASGLFPSRRALEIIALFAAAIECAASALIAGNIVQSGAAVSDKLFSVDPLGCLVLLTVAIVGFLTAVYSVGYLQEEMRKGIIGFSRVREYYCLLHLFMFAMFFAVITTVPILMWIAVEASTLSTALLVSFYNKASSMEAAWKYLIINSIGLLLGFFGTLLFLTAVKSGSGFVDWETLRAHAALLDPRIAKIAFSIILIGYGTKIGLVPMHTWKPDVYSKAPAPVAALFSGALLNVALLAILRFMGIANVALGPLFSQHLLLFFGMLSLLYAALVMFTQWNYKRLLAYSSIEHAGIMLIGFGFGGIGVFASLLHMLYHSLAKSSLFYSAGNVFLKYSSTKIERVQGALRLLPASSIALFAGFLAIAGLPPFGTFMTELYIVSAGMRLHPYLASAVLALLALAFIGFLRQLTRMLFGAPAESLAPGESNYWTIIPPLAAVGIVAVCGLFLPSPLMTLIAAAAKSI